MERDNIVTGIEARLALIRGVTKISDAVKVTMGTGGSNALIEAIESPGHLLTNDGWTIANSIRLADHVENMGRNVLLEAINRANKQSGDGSSTTCLLTAEILKEGGKYIESHNSMEIKRSLEDCIPIIEEALKRNTREIKISDIAKVASISAEDESIGALIQEIYEQIGADGIIHWDISKDYNDHYTLGKGITIDGAGFTSPYMADMDEKTGSFTNTVKWKDATILITKQKISSASDFNEIFQTLFNKEVKEVVVFCDDYEPNIVADLIRTRAVRGFRTVLVKMPTLWKDWWFIDLAKATGATVIDPVGGLTLKTMTTSHLGKVDNITITSTDTYIDGIKDVTDHIDTLKNGTDDDKLRASRLNTNTARYFVGARSDSALSYKRLKVEDAISASYQALHGGVVAGGGVALIDLLDELPNTLGGGILQYAITVPYHQILENAGIEPIDTDLPNHGINTKTGEEVDMFEAGIMDPAPVVLNAIRNAISVAASILTAPVVVQLPRTDN